jgi:hypothetical protein
MRGRKTSPLGAAVRPWQATRVNASEVNCRRRLLERLVHFEVESGRLESDLRLDWWDRGDGPSVSKPVDANLLLQRFLDCQLTASDVGPWANAIECREDIEFLQEYSVLLSELVFEFANPTLSPLFDDARARHWASRLIAATWGTVIGRGKAAGLATVDEVRHASVRQLQSGDRGEC